MKFLLGVIFGVLCAVGVMMFPEAREIVLVELDSKTQEIGEIAHKKKSLSSIKSSFLDASVYTDIVTGAEPQPVLWADQIETAELLPLSEPAVVSSTPNPDSETAVVEDVIPLQSSLPKPVFHAVWSPFRSERSATGFASTLSMRLNREFRVVRLAAGRYEVGFDALSEQELLDVLDSVLEFTSSGASSLQVSL